ncbi:fasciclin domain-containing protein [Eisenibacter elegans]|jgi:uncharacterized surface protein with fasciclin (FAS1) repeats|uniref:fasciclin domain-containing protein n=1 Tax=Eisenibacter elegans TaxID=997 RepID=UPI000479E78D|nr:fasciclin domain-containing protein [Eisenibacter elegans]
MKKLLLSFVIALFISPLVLLTSCGGGGETEAQDSELTETEMEPQEEEVAPMEEAPKAIVALAQSNPELSTLVAALQAAGLVEALEGDGPFTVFAPTNEAFAALGETLDELLKPENKERLANILKYHVVQGSVMSSDLTDNQKAATLNGAEITINTADGVQLNQKAKVTAADVTALNGVVHIIDAVILPPNAQ